MKKHTYRERLEAGLLVFDWALIQSSSRKYNMWVKEGKISLHVGKLGALRAGRTLSESFSIGDPANQRPQYKAYLEAGDRVLALMDAFTPWQNAVKQVRKFYLPTAGE